MNLRSAFSKASALLCYDKGQSENAVPSHRERLRRAIDEALEKKPDSLDALLQSLRDAGYEVKRGKQLAFRGTGQKRFVRMDTLGEGYALDDLLAVIDGKREHTPHKRQPAEQKKVSLAIDIQAKLREGKGAGYERWAKVFNVKQLAKSLNYLTEHDIADLPELAARAEGCQIRDELREVLTVKENVERILRTDDPEKRRLQQQSR